MRYSTNSVLEAVKGQVEKVASDYIESVFIFDGPLQTAINSHLGQPTTQGMNTFAFIAFSDELPLDISASGAPLTTGLYIDINVVVRATGRTRYVQDLQRLYDAVDCVAQDVFCLGCDNLHPDYKSVIVRTQFERRQRLTTEGDIFAHVVRIMVKPKDTSA